MLDPSTIVALEMNGERLPDLHGFPARLIVPGWDGASWVKWLTNMTVQNEPVKGFFMYPAYCYPKHPVEPGKPAPADDLAMIESMPVKSIIGSPEEDAEVSGAVTITGVAWAGEETVERVDVSTDGGGTWSPAGLSPEKYKYAWRLFHYEWKPRTAGFYTLLSRATDSAGRTQPIVSPWNPSGYLWNAIDRVGVKVKG
jgi:DMSO/TMAO reductase YedYZ molybdopterin-dependent catalytic subunit